MPALVLLAALAVVVSDVSASPSVSASPAGDLPEPIYEHYDFFVVAGQSNARGQGEAPLAPEVPAGAAYEVTPQGRISALADPVGRAETGSAWPAFANAYSEATGRGVVLVSQTFNGSKQVWLPGDRDLGTWDVSRETNLYAHTDAKARRALRTAEDALPNVRPAGWLWIQGGTDARRIEDGRLTVEAYEQKLHALARSVGRDWGTPLYLWVSGTDARADSPGIQAVRRVQNQADALDEVVVSYRDAVSFVERGWMQPDHVHWAQPGLNEAGARGGEAVARDRLARSGPDNNNPTAPGYSEGVVIFPNPSATPRVNAGCPFVYAVTDTRGRVLARGRGNGPTDLPRLAPGIYTARVRPLAGRSPECSGTVRFTVAR